MGFSFFMVNTKYCDFLRKTDPCVPYTMDKKSIRPFVGIVFSVNGFHYYAPLTSPKPKHLHMKSQIDFLKIKNGEWGAINFNNMIPVPIDRLTKVELKLSPSDTKADIDYKNLLSNQLSWCNSNRDAILKQASKLYVTITQGKAWGNLAGRCCNFSLDEQQCLIYEKGITHADTQDLLTPENRQTEKPSILEKLRQAKQVQSPENATSNKRKSPDRGER